MRSILLLAGLFVSAAASAQMPPAPATMPEHGDTSPIDYSKSASWACRPGVDDGTCSTNLDATLLIPGPGEGGPRQFFRARVP